MLCSIPSIENTFLLVLHATVTRIKDQYDWCGLKELTRCVTFHSFTILSVSGCSQPHGLEDETIPNEKLTASSTDVSDDVNSGYYWPFRGRLNHDAGSRSWGPYKPDGADTVGNWFQVKRFPLDARELLSTGKQCLVWTDRLTN